MSGRTSRAKSYDQTQDQRASLRGDRAWWVGSSAEAISGDRIPDECVRDEVYDTASIGDQA
jgi:hypothetical protein